ncbi:phosphoesterase [Pseudomonas hormoni]|uniref:Phosphoesterase n=1 Tax=Pseudomonas hormoni TaxID=3093767 RepID=A0ABX8F3Q8_9PSED|nr:phosphoesterase [Pseudomonas hormoni]QVW25163.1 phosphoesterase [Pseudomonas hormoni]
MKTSNYIRLLLLLILTHAPVMQSAASEIIPQHLVFASNPKFPSSEKSENGEVESTSEKEKRSRWLIDAQYTSIADFREQSGGASAIPVMINGNMTASGQSGERSYINAVLQNKLNNFYDYGLGNHDYDITITGCADCAAASIDDLKNRYWGKAAYMDFAARASGQTKTWYGSLAYSQDYGDVHLVQLHNDPTYSANISTGSIFRTTAYEITPSLDWLERDLRHARAQGKIILLNLSQPFHWQVAETEIFRFTKMIEDYGVTAVFSANAYKQSGKYESSNYIYGDIPLFMSGSAAQQTWLHAAFSEDRKQMTVNVIADNDWRNPVASHTIPVR